MQRHQENTALVQSVIEESSIVIDMASDSDNEIELKCIEGGVTEKASLFDAKKTSNHSNFWYNLLCTSRYQPRPDWNHINVVLFAINVNYFTR